MSKYAGGLPVYTDHFCVSRIVRSLGLSSRTWPAIHLSGVGRKGFVSDGGATLLYVASQTHVNPLGVHSILCY